MREKLTPKQAMFVIEYLKDLNGSAAAVRAGYSEDTSKEIASQNLTKPHIMDAIQEQMDARAGRTLITADWVLNNLKELSSRCMQATPVLVFDKIYKKYVQAKDEYGNDIWQFDAGGANKALETMAKHLRLITDRQEHSGPDGAPLVAFPDMQVILVKAPESNA